MPVELTSILVPYTLNDTQQMYLANAEVNDTLDEFGSHVYCLTIGETLYVREYQGLRWKNAAYTWISTQQPVSVADCNIPVYMLDIPVSSFGCTAYEVMYYGDRLTVNDVIRKKVVRTLKEQFGMVETHNHVVQFYRRALESIMLHDSFAHKFVLGIVIKELLHVADQKAATIAVFKDEYLSFSEAFRRVWESYLTLFEALDAQEALKKRQEKVTHEAVQVSDHIRKDSLKSIFESADIEEAWRRKLTFKRLLAELIDMGEAFRQHYRLNKAVDIHILEAYVRASNAVIEAIELSQDIFTENDFMEALQKSPGYESFIDFNVGDYEYEQALMRVQIISNATQSQPLLYDVAARVDIDDTDDRGNVEITDTTGPTKVYYNKHYYTAPEVQATVVGGTGTMSSVAFILSTDGQDEQGRYFEIELHDDSGNLTTGIVAWQAKGW